MFALRFILVACHDAAETEVVGSGTGFAFPARSNDIARAILIRAKVGAAAVDLLGLVGLRWIVRTIGTTRVSRNAAGRSKLLVVIGPIPIACPLPDVACHVVKAVAVGWKLCDGSKPYIAVLTGIVHGKVTLMGINRIVLTDGRIKAS